MNRKAVLLACLVVISTAAAGQKLPPWQEKEELARGGTQEPEQRRPGLEEQEKLVAEARELLDASTGNSGGLIEAAGNLQRVIQANPGNVKARIEMARLHIKAGYINSRNFQPGTLEKAEKELRTALAHDSKSADTLVLLGHIYYLSNRSGEALKVLEQAEKWGTNNPWLNLNWADALMDLHRTDEAVFRLSKAQAQFAAMKNAPRGAVRAMLEKMASNLIAQRKMEEADKAYQTLLAFDPNYAWVRGNYAECLLYKRGMPDAAIAEAEKTLVIMNYGMARLTLASALYAKWAEVKRQSPNRAVPYLERAKAISTHFSWIMPQAAKSVSAGPAIQNMVKELMLLGVPLDTKDDHDDTGLTLAADLGDTESIVLLLKFGAEVESKDNYDRTAIANAAAKGHIETVKALAAHKAKIDPLDRAKLTPLHIAILGKHEAMVRLLISLKADVNNSAGGISPLMRAVVASNERLVRILLEAGADPSVIASITKQTALDIAKKQGSQNLVDLIQEAAEKRTTRGR
jgi:Tfp pilus assembly protein PilF